MAITMTDEQYEQLVGLARRGMDANDGQRSLNDFLVTIEESNDIVRYLLWVRWQEVGQVHPVNKPFPDGWPPTQQVKIERLSTPVSRADVEVAVADRGVNPVGILVSEDPGGQLGWSTIDQYFS